MRRFIVIHGHFYQPTRENPWTGEIPRQDEAHPYHDWNERILKECYRPNAFSRILDGHNRILDIVNNYRFISFDFAPSILDYLKDKDPEVYQRIIEADKEGRGAIAATYNHIILPLANYRDKVTQVSWGIKDFIFRFGRYPEGLWLPETAVDQETLKVLAEFGIRFTILAPSQAKRVKRLHSREWTDIKDGGIDVTRPYRCFLKDGSGRFIDIFFYNRDLSQGISFEGYLKDARALAHKFARSFLTGKARPQVLSVATDGETFGHHEPFGDMAVAHLVRVGAPSSGLGVTNFSRFLELCPPTYEVEINDNSSWSCPHNLGRWKEDCGCHTGGEEGWNQAWRKPLRETLNGLRDKLAEIFEREGGRYLKSVWLARNDYIDILLDKSPAARDKFFAQHGKGPLKPEERARALRLLEMQRQALLMYTSCAWFFNDISGVETVQVMRHAARAMDLASAFTSESLELPFLWEISRARSNIPEYSDGGKIYWMGVMPSRIRPEEAAHDYLLTSHATQTETGAIYIYRVEKKDEARYSKDGSALHVSHLCLTSTITEERFEFVSLLTALDGEMTHFIKEFSTQKDYEKLKEQAAKEFQQTALKLVRQMGFRHMDLKDLSAEVRHLVLARLSERAIRRLREVYEEIYRENRTIIERLASLKMKAPEELERAVRLTLSHQLAKEMEDMEGLGSPAKWQRIREIIYQAKGLGYPLNTEDAKRAVERWLVDKVRGLKKRMEMNAIKEIEVALAHASELGMEPDKSEAQNHLFEIISSRLPHSIEACRHLINIAERLNFNVDRLR